MKKLLLLLLVVVGIVGCDKAEDVPSKSIIITKPESSIQEYYQEEAKKYNINIDGIVFNDYRPNEVKNITTFTGLKNGIIWVRRHDYTTKKEIFAADGEEKLDTVIKYTEPYVGEIIDTINGFRIASLEYLNNDGLIQIDYTTKKNKTISDLSFCNNNTIIKSINIKKAQFETIPSIKYFNDFKYWINDYWVVRYMIWNNPSGGGYEYFDYYSLKGDFVASIKIDYHSIWGNIFDLRYIIPLNMTEFILNNEGEFDDNEISFNFRKINIEKGYEIIWGIYINLNIQSNDITSLVKRELINNNSTLQLTYNVNHYDGTKTTKTVNIDVNTGEYTVL